MLGSAEPSLTSTPTVDGKLNVAYKSCIIALDLPLQPLPGAASHRFCDLSVTPCFLKHSRLEAGGLIRSHEIRSHSTQGTLMAFVRIRSII